MRTIHFIFLLLPVVALEAVSADGLTPEQRTALAAVDVRLGALDDLAAKIDDADYQADVVKQIEELKNRRLALEKNFDPALYETLMHSVISRYQVAALWLRSPPPGGRDESRVRLIVETDAGGDPDDEQSLVRLLVYASEFDIEGLIANRAVA